MTTHLYFHFLRTLPLYLLPFRAGKGKEVKSKLDAIGKLHSTLSFRDKSRVVGNDVTSRGKTIAGNKFSLYLCSQNR
jgi:hypothetical protein